MKTLEKMEQNTGQEANIQNPKTENAGKIRELTTETLEKKQEIISEVLTSAELTDEKLDEISDFFRLIFNNDWPEFLVCTDCDSSLPQGMRLSAKEVFKTEEHVSLEQMDSFKDFPDCPNCNKPTKLFHDPKKTRENIEARLKDDGYVSLLRSGDEGKIAGFVFGYGATLEEEYNHEWSNAYHYMAEENPEYNRSLDDLIKLLDEHVPDRKLDRESEVFAWNCVAIGPDARGMRHFVTVMKAFFNSLPPKERDKTVVGEVLKKSAAHSIFHTLGGIDVPDYLDGDDTIIIGHVGTIKDRMNRSTKRKK